MKQLSALFVLLFVASALSVGVGETIEADYDAQVIQYENTLLHQLTSSEFSPVNKDSHTIHLTQFNLLYGTQVFSLVASDIRENLAAHQTTFTLENPLGMQLVNPSELGFSNTPNFLLGVETEQEATCEWRFHTLTQNPNSYEELLTNEGEYHYQNYSFAETYRLQENEHVPIEIRCANHEHKQTLIAHIGWSEETLGASTFTLQQRETTIVREDRKHPVRLDVHSKQQSTCVLEHQIRPEQSITSYQREHHVFNQLPNTIQDTYWLTCLNARGEETSIGAWRGSFLNKEAYPQEQQPIITVRSAQEDNSINHLLIVETSIPSTCRQTLREARMGSYEQGLLHQRTLLLEPGVHEGEIVCQASNGQTSTKQHQVHIQPPLPSITVHEAQLCTETNEVLLHLQHSENTKYVLITGENYAVMREPARTLRQKNLAEQSITVQAIDSLQRTSPEQTITLTTSTCAPTHPQHITVQPTNNRQNSFILEVQTQHPSTCTVQGERTTTNNQQTTHTLSIDTTTPETIIQPATTTEIEVVCTDTTGQVTTKKERIHSQLPTPEITVQANPQTLTNYANPLSKLLIQANQEVTCRVDEKAYNLDYNTTHEIHVALTKPTNQTFLVTCMNHHGEETQQPITIEEEYPSELVIDLLHTNIHRTDEVLLRVRTSIPATCQAQFPQQADLMARIGQGYDHQLLQVLPEGRHPYTVVCDETATTKQRSKQSELIIDQTPPTINLTGPQISCGLNRYTIYGQFRDNIQTSHLNIRFADNTYERTTLPATLNNLNLTEGQRYTLTITGYDAANNSVEVTDTITASKSTEGACDTEPPRVTVQEQDGNEGKKIYVFCKDNVACAQEFRFGTAIIGSECEMQTKTFLESEDPRNKQAEPIPLTQPRRICWEVRDEAGNTVEGSRNIEFTAQERPEHCFDGIISGDETGVDCGGSCAACQEDPSLLCSDGIKNADETDTDCGGPFCDACAVGQSCKTFRDCESRVCIEGVCQAPTCNDGIKNAQETGRDCGGPECEACPQGEGCTLDSDCQGALVCSHGTCMDEHNQRTDSSTPPSQQEPFGFEEPKSRFLAFLFIILGVLTAAGGGGWIAYEKQQENLPTTSTQIPTQPTQQSYQEVEEQKPPETDFSISKLREEARTKRQQERENKRNQLLGSFEKQKIRPEDRPDVFKELEEITNNKKE